MPDTEPQSMPAEEITPPAKEPQTPTPAPEPSPSEHPSVFETKPAEPDPAPIELPPTPETPASVEPPSTPINNLQPTTPPEARLATGGDNQAPAAQTPQSQPSEPTRQNPLVFLQRAREKIQFRKKARQEKIMALAAKKRSITNDDVEKLLRVSDATATRYLAELVRQGRLKPSGVRGSAKYEPL